MQLQLVFLVALCITLFDLTDGAGPYVIDVTKFGAIGNGYANDARAFSQAWMKACSSAGNPVLLIPHGKTFLLQPTIFQGPCRSPITRVQILGDIVAPKSTNWGACGDNSWLLFSRVNGLDLFGSGQINGRGSGWWSRGSYVMSSALSRCERPTALRFVGCNNVQLKGLTHLDSPRNHIAVVDSSNVVISNVRIIAPEDSPNTDGIDISGSTRVTILNSVIGTGDDCIAIKAGTTNVNISGVACGPGHGISIGSLGDTKAFETVEDVFVRNCSLTRTQNGVRIKTWPGGRGFVRRIAFQQIKVNAAKNPIIIDQDYCNGGDHCGNQVSNVKVTDVLFDGVHGSSATPEAISLQCSAIGCNNVQLREVNIISASPRKTKVQTLCKNVQGRSIATIPTVPCLKGANLFGVDYEY